MPPKSIFRNPGAKHFQLVHRSQRDPLIHDPEASTHVLKQVVRENEKKGKSRAELEAIISPSDLSKDIETNVGEAAAYGVYYDDTEYNYMQHLKPVGGQEDGVDSVWIEAPSTSKKVDKKDLGISLKDLPKESLPSTSELPRTYDSHKAIPDSISGFQPDMDPHLRQALEALEDDAFVDDGLEDDFFGELVQAGERASDEDFDYEFNEDGEYEGDGQDDPVEEDESWEQRFARFKLEKKKEEDVDDRSEENFGTEGGDTISGLPAISVIGGKGKRRRKGTSDASGYSMSSSSMFRNDALQTLDQRFDQVMLKQYNSDEESDGDDFPGDDDDDDEAPQLITSREDFTSMMDEFLNGYEILGRKLRPKLSGDTGAEKLNTLRRALGQDDRVRIRDGYSSDEDGDVLREMEEEDKKDRWDCETILTTYSNLENHPRLIRARDPKPVPKILLDPKTGLPSVLDGIQKLPKAKPTPPRVVTFKPDDDTEDSGDDEDHHPRRQAVGRSKNESAEEKKARKAAVKAERAARRVDKKATKEVFSTEMKVQTKARNGRDIERGMKKL